MKRKHNVKIKAWADNKELLVLTKRSLGWEHLTDGAPAWLENKEYFPCLPKHKEAVLALLNGGEAQVKYIGYDVWDEAHLLNSWWVNSWYMNESAESRVKPKKEVRYAYYVKKSGSLTNSFETEEELNTLYPNKSNSFQLITFEVEVE